MLHNIRNSKKNFIQFYSTFGGLKIKNCIDSGTRSWPFFRLCQSNSCFSLDGSTAHDKMLA